MFSKTIFAGLIALVLFTTACDRLETIDRYYPKYEDLREKDEPGNWIPKFIPQSSVEIRGRHKVDTAASLVTFYFGAYEDLSLAGHCIRVTAKDAQLPTSGFLSVTWWPDSLFGDRTNSMELNQYELYRCERETFLALKQIEGRYQAFYWHWR